MDQLDQEHQTIDTRRFEEEVAARKESGELRRSEIQVKREENLRNYRERYTGTATAAVAAAFALCSAVVTAYLGGLFSLQTERQKSSKELTLQEQRSTLEFNILARKADAEIALQRERIASEQRLRELDRQFQLLIKATENRTRDEAAQNVLFFVDLGYLPDPDGKLRKKVEKKDLPIFRSIENPLTTSNAAAQFGIDNTPPAAAAAALEYLRVAIIEPIEKQFGKQISVQSGYRSDQLNAAVRGSQNSPHSRGEAVDFTVEGKTNQEVACWIKENLQYDQLFLEPLLENLPAQWIHVSAAKGSNQRKELRITCNR